jgi:predicted metal-dependent hydrolase
MSRPATTRCLALPDGRSLELQLRRSPRARNMLIRILEVEGCAELVLPRRVSLAEGWSFVEERAGWIDERLAELPPRVPFEDGAVTPYRGAPIGLRRGAGRRNGGAVLRDGLLEVPGPSERFARAVRSWYVAEARRELGLQAHAIAAGLDRTVRRITIRDPDTRWGSCSSNGHLSFSWRLMMAPPEVIAYVVTHEVAHLKAMHHGRAFWALVERLYGDPAPARRWLNDHGLALRRYG